MPGDAVHHQVVDDQQQAIGLAGAQVEADRAQQGAVAQVQAGLGVGSNLFQGGPLFFHGQGGQIDLPQQVGLLLRRGILLFPACLRRAKRSRKASWCAARWSRACPRRPGATGCCTANSRPAGSGAGGSCSRNQCWMLQRAPVMGPCSACTGRARPVARGQFRDIPVLEEQRGSSAAPTGCRAPPPGWPGMESPKVWKKLSCTPTRSRPRTSAQRLARASSASAAAAGAGLRRGGWRSEPAQGPGGRACRCRSVAASRNTKAEGNLAVLRQLALQEGTKFRLPWGDIGHTHQVGHQTLPPGPPRAAAPRPAAPPGVAATPPRPRPVRCGSRGADLRRSSRPRNSQVAAAAASVRGRRCSSREPGWAANGSGEALGGQARPVQVAPGQPRPADVQFTRHPHRHRRRCPSSTYTCVFAIGTPIGTISLIASGSPDRVTTVRSSVLGGPVSIHQPQAGLIPEHLPDMGHRHIPADQDGEESGGRSAAHRREGGTEQR